MEKHLFQHTDTDRNMHIKLSLTVSLTVYAFCKSFQDHNNNKLVTL